MPTVGELLEQARALTAGGQRAQAEAIYRGLVEQLPEAGEIWGELGIFYLSDSRPDAALLPLERATEASPQHGAFHGALGAAYRQLKRYGEAVASFERALAIGPPAPELYNNLALAQKDAGVHPEALRNIDAALSMRPDFQTAHYNRGNLLLAIGRFDDAVASLRAALALWPEDTGALCSLGLAHRHLGQLDGAISACERALAIRPDYAEVRRNLAHVWFLQGQDAKAWPAYESRLACEDFVQREIAGPRWDGSPLSGQTLFVYAEQGLGDVVQFVRYLPLAARAAGRVWFEPYELLRPLLANSGFEEYLVPAGALPRFDVHAPLLSLAGHLPDGGGAPFWPGAYLAAAPKLAAHWKERLRDVTGLKVGIAWAGNPRHVNDRFRSTRLASFAPLARVSGVQLINLQKGPGREQLAECGPDLNVADLGDSPQISAESFVETAAVIANLDLVISVDTVVVHLAGAMGKPVWVALPFVPDWRWRSHGATTAWYPEMRLFRQRAIEDWPGVFAEMAAALQQLVEHTSS